MQIHLENHRIAVDIPQKTLQDFWREAVQQSPSKTAVVCQERRLTFAEADGICTTLALNIQRVTSRPRPVVAICMPNCLEYFLLYWATVKLGGIVVPINPWLKTDSLDTILDTVRPQIAFYQDASSADFLAALARHPSIPAFSSSPLPQTPALETLLRDSTGALLPQEHLAMPQDPAIIMHTSGTTSAPKGAVMCHGDLIFNVLITIIAQDFNGEDVHLLVNPMYHCTALYSSLPAAAYQKTPVVITQEVQPDKLLPLIQKEKITTFLTVPSILQRITAFPALGDYDLSSLRVIGYAGSFMPVKTVLQLQRLFPNAELHNFFGMTETISATHVLNGADSRERPDSIGKLLPCVTARINDDNGAQCPPNVPGELLFARENVISQYWGKPGKLEENIVEQDGRLWFRTGDIAMVDEQGFFFIKGRKKDMIIVGGENVFASEVEAALLQMDAIKEAAVIGIPATGLRESLGEMIKAFVVLEDGASLTENEIRRHCRKNLPSYKNPHEYQFLDALPRNPSGKVLKNQLQ